jgi:ribosome-associated protein
VAAADDELRVSSALTIPAAELEWRFSASSGPGGQHVNTANTRVEVRFDVANSPSLTDAQRARLLEKVGPDVRVVSQSERSQLRNRARARERLAARLAEGLVVPRTRRPTRASRASVKRRLDAKSRQSERKQQRRAPGLDEG